ncbi:MAG TPA: hypothetical protein VF030_04935, partial [Solirubrobacterales bacterium]
MRTGKRLLLLTTLGSLLLAFSASASAAPRDPIASGTTDLHMKKGMLRKLGNLGVTVQAVGTGATSTSSKIGLSVRDGMLDPTDVQGFLQNRGGFKLQLGNRGVPVTQLTVNTVKGAVFAKIAKARMQLGTFAPPTFEREGFGANFKAVKLSLTEKAVRRISNRLGLRGSKRLNPGRVLSNLYSTAEPETVTLLPQGNATLTGNASTLAKFAAKGVKVPEGFTAIAPATKPTATSFALPIAGGTLAPDASKGMVETAGGVQILKDTDSLDPTMRLSNVQIDFAAKTATVQLEILPSPPFPGAAGRAALVDVVIPSNGVSANPVARTISI